MTKQHIMEKFEIAEATFKRDIELLRDRFGADIQYDTQDKVYRLVSSGAIPAGAQLGGDKAEVPGLWFNEHSFGVRIGIRTRLEKKPRAIERINRYWSDRD